jgi:hypothetical protein
VSLLWPTSFIAPRLLSALLGVSYCTTVEGKVNQKIADNKAFRRVHMTTRTRGERLYKRGLDFE